MWRAKSSGWFDDLSLVEAGLPALFPVCPTLWHFSTCESRSASTGKRLAKIPFL